MSLLIVAKSSAHVTGQYVQYGHYKQIKEVTILLSWRTSYILDLYFCTFVRAYTSKAVEIVPTGGDTGGRCEFV